MVTILTEVVMNIHRSSCKVPFIVCLILTKLAFSQHILVNKCCQYKISQKSVQWEPGSMWQT
jgi:hypothetical protein